MLELGRPVRDALYIAVLVVIALAGAGLAT
jgi:hypothetical protein